MSVGTVVNPMGLRGRLSSFCEVIDSLAITNVDGGLSDAESAMAALLDLLIDLRKNERMLFVLGNGGSAAVASHAVTDFLNVGKLRATTVHDSSLITCMANDYGYESAYGRILETLARPGDALIAISSSGRSPNIAQAVRSMRERGGHTITLSGFSPGNLLRGLGDHNLWLDSSDYGFVEIGHQFLLHNLADRLRGL
ncbi:MAG: SIS domain-containing protein [Rhizobium sp.]|nr:SIS domain-containing protein [Rhizobium sp.]